MQIKELISKIQVFCPESIQEEWDNSGMQIFTGNEEIERVLIALEITSDIIDEATENDVDLIICHHPLFFDAIKRIDASSVVGNFAQRLIAADINVYSCHTNFDKIFGGNNDFLGNILAIDGVFQKDPDHNGILRNGIYEVPHKFKDLIDLYSYKLGIDKQFFSAVGNLDRMITKVAICTGAGGEFIEEAWADKCDLLITGDVKYHQAMEARELGLCVLDIGHYGSERIFKDAFLGQLIANEFPEGLFLLASRDINPFEKI